VSSEKVMTHDQPHAGRGIKGISINLTAEKFFELRQLSGTTRVLLGEGSLDASALLD